MTGWGRAGRRTVRVLALGLALGAAVLAQPLEAGDALGAGLTPPTAARYADPAWYDLLDARWATDAAGATVFELELAAIDPEAPLLQPIVEAYLLHPDAAGRAALPGTGLEAPDEVGWAVAVRVAGASAWAWTAGSDAPAEARPLPFEVVGRTVRFAWPADLPAEGAWVAVSGVYDPFADTGWRPFAAEASPWAFAAPPATPPIVSVVPGGDDALVRLHATARLPRGVARAPIGSVSPWWWWMGAGMVLVVVGLAWRGRPPRAAATPAAEASTPAADASTPAAEAPPALIGDDDVAAVGTGAGEGAAGPSEGAGPAEAVQSEAAERSEGDAAAATGAPADEPSSSRTTRAPSPASRSAKRS